MEGAPSVPPNIPLEPLPPGWTEHRAPEGQPYYYNAITKVSTYTRPRLQPPPNFPPPPTGFSAPPGFQPPMMPIQMPMHFQPPVYGVVPGQQRRDKEKEKGKEKAAKRTPIGEEWIMVETNEGNTFFRNKKNKTSFWEVPEEIKDEVEEILAQRKLETAPKIEEEEEMKEEEEEEEVKEESPRGQKRKPSPAVEEEKPKKKKAKQQVVASVEDLDEEWQKSIAAEMAAEAEAEAEEEKLGDEVEDKNTEVPSAVGGDAVDIDLSADEAKAVYKAMLFEKDINPMSPWDMELPKFVNDKRYLAVKNTKDRRDIFDEWCKEKIRENRAAKKEKEKAAKVDPAQAYRNLLIETVSSTRTHWEDFKRDHKRDSRFREYGRDDREREKVFKSWLRELGERKRADAQKAEERFLEMLRSSKDIVADSKWKDVKGSFSSDPRYTAVKASKEREGLFDRYLEELKKGDGRGKSSVEEKKEASLREREKAVLWEKERTEKEVRRAVGAANREEGQRVFEQLLIDAVRNENLTWEDALPGLKKDPRFEGTSLRPTEKIELFNRHIEGLKSKRSDAVEKLFETHAPSLDTTFETVFPQISDNPAVTRLSLTPPQLEENFNAFQRRRLLFAKQDFEQLMGENSFIEFWGRIQKDKSDKEAAKKVLDEEGLDEEEYGETQVDLGAMAKSVDLKDIHKVLQHDKRYRMFDYDPELRESMIRDYLSRLGGQKLTVHQK
ncbi:hypothetical protein BT69DRAFT_1252051 [Atractiella rhizophila]|nr:hypothetical protein BT69DRAFT_1252051 [Atractiella rhizophila]